MSHTLNLVAGLLTAARNFQATGRTGAALDLLQRLAKFQGLAPATAEEIHSRLADLSAEEARFKSARRHLTIALTYRPRHADYHHRMACCIEADGGIGTGRAARYYRQAVRSEPDNAEYWADYGAYLLSAGRLQLGQRALRRAFRLASHDTDLVGFIAAELRQAGLWDEARRLLRRARFQHGRAQAFAALWQQHQFEELCAAQEKPDQAPARRRSRPTILPFLRANLNVAGKTIRVDSAEKTGMTLPLPKRQSRNPGNRQSK